MARAAAADPLDAALDDLLTLVTRVAGDAVAGGQVAVELGAAVAAAAPRLLEQGETGLAAALARLEALGRPFVDALEVELEQLSAAEDADAVVAGLLGLVDRVADGASALTAERIRQRLAQLVDALETDLGLTPDVLVAQVELILDDATARLEGRAGDADAQAAARALRRLRARVRGELRLPALDAARLAEELYRWLERTGILGVAARVACVARALGDTYALGSGVVRLVPFTGFGTGSVGAAAAAASEERYCWYASWLMAAKGRPWYYGLVPLLPDDEVWAIGGATPKVELRRTWRGDRDLLVGGDDWRQASIFDLATPLPDLQDLGLEGHYTFGRTLPDRLETVAFVSAVVVNALESVFHLISLEEGDYASNAMNAFLNASFAVDKARQRRPLPWWFDQLVCRGLSTTVTSLEGTHTRATLGNWLTMWLTLLGPDLGEVVAYRSVLNGLRDLVLGVMTLRNDVTPTNPAAGGRPAQNHREVDALVGLFGAVFGKLLAILIPHEDYCYPFISGKHFVRTVVFWEALGGFAFGLVAGLLGTLFGVKLLAGAPGVGPLESQLLRAGVAGLHPGAFWSALYSEKEGNTRNARYNPGGGDFRGYPPAASSPYRLPYPKGESVYVGQANHGLWSHNLVAGHMVYAYDFSLDEDGVILAARPGTVVDFFDWVPNDTDPKSPVPMPAGVTPAPGQTRQQFWNFVLLRHDVDDAGSPAAPDPAHDLGPNGAPVVTYGVYGHGRTGSVRGAFAEKLGLDPAAITPADIIRAAAPLTVRRGEKIMLCGDTGTSFHNHLHMEVQVEAGPGSNVRGRRHDASFTIPFVFREVSRFLDTDGVCTRFNFYTSDNG